MDFVKGMAIRYSKKVAFRDISSEILFEPVIVNFLFKQ